MNTSWQTRIGHQRDFIWRGWQTRYTYLGAQQVSSGSPDLPLVLLHGFGASIEHWRKNIAYLSQQRTVYAVDLLGFGASVKASTRYKVDLWVEQVHDLWQAVIRQPIVLVGNSLGSLVGMSLAAKYPEMVKGLVMLSLPDVSLRQEMLPAAIAPLVITLENLVASPLLIKNLLKFLRKPPIIRRWAQVAYEDETAIDRELVQILSRPAYDEGAARTFYRLFQGVRQPSFAKSAKEVLPRLEIPILLVWGEQDKMVPGKLAPFFAQMSDRIELVQLPNMGHCPHDENPEVFNQLLTQWLEKFQVQQKFNSEL